ncbi:AraC family transcriptional regulator, partial [Lactobacillus sp. XV13L]|nr:AraC family transcriptional regulator [Lactobacillus sp. XV13L]
IEYMNKNFVHKVKMNDIARKCSISSSQLSRDFKKYTGLSLHRYLLKTRIKEAKRMLVQDTTIPLERVAAACGFTDASHLYKKIKEATGMAPGEFRKKYY